jgi:hypothetical protein
MRRWIIFAIVAALAAGTFGAVTWLLGVPDPGLECNPADLIGSQIAHAEAFGNWLFLGSFWAAAGVALLVWAALYLQLFHKAVGRLAWMAATLVCMVVGVILAAYWLRSGTAWAFDQRPSCLDEALATASAASYASMSGRILDSPSWQRLVYADLGALVIVASAIGIGMYLTARKIRKH